MGFGISRRHAGIKILFMSGYPRRAIGGNGVLDSRFELLSKPFTLNSLAEKVAQVLQDVH